jgi:alpha-galactosidase
MARRISEALGIAEIVSTIATTGRAASLVRADFVILMTQAGGHLPATGTDFEAPKSSGSRHTIDGAFGISGIFRTLRTIPVVFEIEHNTQ